VNAQHAHTTHKGSLSASSLSRSRIIKRAARFPKKANLFTRIRKKLARKLIHLARQIFAEKSGVRVRRKKVDRLSAQ